jgi:UDP-N-acetylglucosamine acyltransferase
MRVHPTAVVDPGARLGAGVVVGPHAVLEADTVVGDGCEIRAHAVIKRFTRMGSENVVHEAAILGGEPQDVAFRGASSEVRIGDRNKIREGVTIHRGTEAGSATVVGSDCFLMAYAHVAHNCRLGDGVIMANGVLLAIEQMTALADPLVDEMVAFVRGSKRGFHHAERAREAEAE